MGSPAPPGVPFPSVRYRRPSAAQLEETIAEQSDLLTWITTGIFVLSLFSSIVRSDPTMSICLFGFYGAHVRSQGAIRSFWVFLSLSLAVDCAWMYQSSGLNPFTWEQLEQLQRQGQIAVALTVLNMFYKLVVIAVSVRLQLAFSARALARDEAGEPSNPAADAGCTSSGEARSKSSLASQDSAQDSAMRAHRAAASSR